MEDSFYGQIDSILTGFASGVAMPVSTSEFVLNIAYAALLGGVLYLTYSKSSLVRQGDARFAALLALILVLTATIITFIKASLVLSIGLVGALSIVRFRTPIKDPVDLGFLFAAIALGIGIGASQTKLVTIATIAFIILVFLMGKLTAANRGYVGYLLEVVGVSELAEIAKLYELLQTKFTRSSIVRIELAGNEGTVFFEVFSSSGEAMVRGMSDLGDSKSGYSFNFIRSQQ